MKPETFAATLKLYKDELQLAHGRIREHLDKINELTTLVNDVQRVGYIKRYIARDLRYKGVHKWTIPLWESGLMPGFVRYR
ncbi:hypothetical protein PRIC1_014098 [Phytophthora ramorum]